MNHDDRMFLLAAIASHAPLGEARDLAVEMIKAEIARLKCALPGGVDDRPISYLGLNVRAENCIRTGNIETVGQLITQSRRSLLTIRSFGRTSLREVQRKLADIGLSLAPDVRASEVAP